MASVSRRRRRQADRVRADVARDERAGLRRGRQLDPVAIDEQPDAAVAERRPRGRRGAASTVVAVDAGERGDLAPGERPLGDEQQRLEGRLGQLDRRRSSVAAAGASHGSAVGRAVDVRPTASGVARVVGHANDSRRLVERASSSIAPAPDRPRRAPRRSWPGDDRAPRLGLLDDDLAPLHQLEHRQERDGDDDPVADARQQVLEDDRRARRAGPRG